MKDARGTRVSVNIECAEATFRASGKTISFAGFLRAYTETSEDQEDEKEKTTDSMWQNVVSRADILAPGIVVSKPQATNFKKVTSAVKRKALSIGMTKDHASLIKPLLGNKKIKNLNGETLDTIFVAASEVVKKVNDAKVQSKTMQMKDLSCHNELASINQRNKEFWNKK